MATDPNGAIDEAQAAANAQLQALLAQYAQRVQQYNQSTENAYASALAQMQGTQGAVATDLAGQGFSPGAAGAQGKIGLAHLSEQLAAQRSLSDRLSQTFTGGLNDRIGANSQLAAAAKAQLAAYGAIGGGGGRGGRGGRGGGGYGGSDYIAQGDAGALAEADTPLVDYRIELLNRLGGVLKPKAYKRVEKWLMSGHVNSDLSNLQQDFSRLRKVIADERKGGKKIGIKLNTLQRKVGNQSRGLSQKAQEAARKQAVKAGQASYRGY